MSRFNNCHEEKKNTMTGVKSPSMMTDEKNNQPFYGCLISGQNIDARTISKYAILGSSYPCFVFIMINEFQKASNVKTSKYQQ